MSVAASLMMMLTAIEVEAGVEPVPDGAPPKNAEELAPSSISLDAPTLTRG